MFTTNATALRRNLFGILEQTIKYNEPVSVSTKEGNAVILSEDDYNSIMETLYLTSIPGMREKIIDGLATPPAECLTEDHVSW